MNVVEYGIMESLNPMGFRLHLFPLLWLSSIINVEFAMHMSSILQWISQMVIDMLSCIWQVWFPVIYLLSFEWNVFVACLICCMRSNSDYFELNCLCLQWWLFAATVPADRLKLLGTKISAVTKKAEPHLEDNLELFTYPCREHAPNRFCSQQ